MPDSWYCAIVIWYLCICVGNMGPGGFGLALRPCLYLCWSSDLAWISSQTLWWAEDTHIHICFVTHPLRFHQNICKTHTHAHTHYVFTFGSLGTQTRCTNERTTNKCVCITQADIFAGALFIQVSLGWDLYLSTGILLLITAAYTVTGKHCARNCLLINNLSINTKKY